MDLTTTPEQEQLRGQLREWLRNHLPWEYGVGLPPRFDDLGYEVAFGRRWQSDLAGAGWVAVTWPVAYGGRGLGPAENFGPVPGLYYSLGSGAAPPAPPPSKKGGGKGGGPGH